MELELRSVEPQGAQETGARPYPRGKGVGPLVFIFGEDFLLNPQYFFILGKSFYSVSHIFVTEIIENKINKIK